MFNPNKVEIINKEIVVETGSYKKLKEILSANVYNRENSNKVVFINLVFPKVNKIIEKNIIKLFNEDYKLFNYQNNLGNRMIIFTSVLGNFDFDFSQHNNLKNEILEKLNKVNSKYETIINKIENQKTLIKKELVTKYSKANVLNRNLSYILEQAINYDSYLFENNNYLERANLDLNVDFQRDIVWNLKQKQDLILSLINDIPIGNFYINKINIYSEKNKHPEIPLKQFSEIDDILYDGKQRINAILEYIMGEFPVTICEEEFYFGNLSIKNQHMITNKTVNVYETEFNNKNDLIDFYILLNKNQTAHKKEDFDKALSFKK